MVQQEPVTGNVEATLALMESVVNSAGRNGLACDLLVFPELFVTGYLPDLWERWPSPEDEELWIQRITHMASKNDLGIVFGHPSYRAQVQGNDRGKIELDHPHLGESKLVLYNAASFVLPEGLVGTFAKVHLYGDEHKTFKAGDSFPIWETPW